MRTNKYLVNMVMSLAVIIGLGLSSCKKDEPTPVIAENPLDAEVYYIAGKVTSESNALEGVKVSASNVEAATASDGTFQLEMKSKDDCIVTFEKSGYVTVTAEVGFPADAKKQSIVLLSQELETKNQPGTISPDTEQTVIEMKRKMIELTFPAGAVKSATDVTVTAYKEGAKKILTGTMRASLSSVNCEPDGQSFEKLVELRMKNPASKGVYFADVKHYVEKNGMWNETGTTEYNGKGYYVTSIDGFSNHSFGVLCSSQKGTSKTENLKSIVIDNLGKMDSQEQSIDVTSHFGWKIDGTTSDLLRKQLVGLSDSDITALSGAVELALASLVGGTPSIDEITLKRDARISGDMKTTVSIVERTMTAVFGFPIVFGGQTVALTIPVVKYEGVDLVVTTEKGASHGTHSGGSGE